MRKSRRGAPEWVTTAELCQLLNCSDRHLFNLRVQGVLKRGMHWKVKNPKASRLTYLYHSQRCQQALEQLETIQPEP